MDQKTVPFKVDFIDPITENLDHDFFQSGTRVTDLKSLDQALHNISLAMELLEEADVAYEKIGALLSEIKQLAAPSLASNFDPSQRSTLEVKISLKKKELDQLSILIQVKGKRILDGSLSASRDAEQHLYLMAGVTGSPENRINLNTGLNIPKISCKTLGLGTTFFNTPEEGIKTMMVVENALGIVTRLKGRSQALKALLHRIKRSIDVSIANHQAAKSAPCSLAKADEFLKTIHCLNQKH
jgi:flagellin-like hook-associated protein FlgL